ncbi:MAG: RHS repeat protein [Phycisphaeraceae bacterium]|nr:RHS repeat protein [Phycisphaeraceae bacterium]
MSTTDCEGIYPAVPMDFSINCGEKLQYDIRLCVPPCADVCDTFGFSQWSVVVRAYLAECEELPDECVLALPPWLHENWQDRCCREAFEEWFGKSDDSWLPSCGALGFPPEPGEPLEPDDACDCHPTLSIGDMHDAISAKLDAFLSLLSEDPDARPCCATLEHLIPEFEEALRCRYLSRWVACYLARCPPFGDGDTMEEVLCPDIIARLAEAMGGAVDWACIVPGALPCDDCEDPNPETDEPSSPINCPFTPDPVDLQSGAKAEFEPDIAVQVPGADFEALRYLTSNPRFDRGRVLGERQTLSVFDYVHSGFSLADPPIDGAHHSQSWLFVDLYSHTGRTRFISPTVHRQYASFPTEYTYYLDAYRAGMPGGQYVLADALTVAGVHHAVWKVVIPSVGARYFYRAWPGGADSGLPDPAARSKPLRRTQAELTGLLLAEDFIYAANQRLYTYHLIPKTDGRVARLAFVDINRSGTDVAARIHFDWDTARGWLRRVRVERPGAGGMRLTQQVEYRYVTDQSPGPFHDDVGTSGDLALVIQRERIDCDRVSGCGSDAWYTRYWHYRFHGENSEDGNQHQLRMIIAPEQIEYVARFLDLDQEHVVEVLCDSADGARPWELLGLDLRVSDLARKIISRYETDTESEQRVLEQFVRDGCDCSGPSAGGRRLTYSYWEGSASITGLADDPETLAGVVTTMIVDEVEEFVDSEPVYTPRYHRFHHVAKRPFEPHDLEGDLPAGFAQPVTWIALEAVVDLSGPETGCRRAWAQSTRTDGRGEVIEEYAPSATDCYEPGSDSTPAAWTASPMGLARAYAYDGFGNRIGSSVWSGEAFVAVECIEYGAPGESSAWPGPPDRHLPVRRSRFPSGGLLVGPCTPDDGVAEVVEYTYEFMQGAEAAAPRISRLTTRRPLAVEERNGPSEDPMDPLYATTDVFYDVHGQVAWQRSGTNVLTHRTWSPLFGHWLTETVNAEHPGTGAVPGGYGRQSGPRLTTTRTFDEAGRIRSITDPTGVTVSWSRELRRCQMNGVHDPVLLATVELPHKTGASGPFAGPARITWATAGGAIVARREFLLTSSQHDESITSYTLGDETARTVAEVGLFGKTTESRTWHELDAGWGAGFDTTSWQYDALGRVIETRAPSGTVETVEYDVIGRVARRSIGVLDNGSVVDSTPVVEYEYDGGGVGNSVVTAERRFVDENAATDRVIVFHYDNRDRLILTVNPLPPHTASRYDNLDRLVATAAYAGEVPPDVDDDTTDESEGRVTLIRYFHDERGLLFRQAVATNPTEADAEAVDFLETHFWYDADGAEVGRLEPGGIRTKTTWAPTGVPGAVYVTDGGGDPAPMAPGNFAAVHNAGTHLATLAGDRVLRQTEWTLDPAGLPRLATVRRMVGGSTHTGALTAGGHNAFAVHLGMAYDAFGRLVRELNFGTGDEEFSTASTPPTQTFWVDLPDPGDSGYEDVIIAATQYDELGRPSMTIDPAGVRTRRLYDDAGRVRALVENYDTGWTTVDADVSADTVTWPSGSTGHRDRNRVTTFQFDAGGRVIREAAHDPGSGTGSARQVTQYVYGARLSDGSTISSMDLIAEVRHPDPQSGDPGESAALTVSHTWNRQGERTSSRDQNGTVHAYAYDALGRLTSDQVTTFGSGPGGYAVDDAVDRIAFERGYDPQTFEWIERARSRQGTTVLNAVEHRYDHAGRLTSIRRAIDDDIGEETPEYRLTYEVVPFTDESDIRNFARIASVRYPLAASESVEWRYIAGGADPDDLDARISRVQTLVRDPDGNDERELVTYGYFGLSDLVRVDYPVPAVRMDRGVYGNTGAGTFGSSPTSEATIYPGLDRFGRPVSHLWIRDRGGSGLFTTAESVYDRDLAGNVLRRHNVDPHILWNHQEGRFGYDGLHRLLVSDEGLDGGQGFQAAPESRAWSLDMLGNWAEVAWQGQQDPESREHDLANQTLSVTPPIGPEYALTYDHAGNLIRRVSDDGSSTTTVRFQWDAWNRLVAVTSAVDQGAPVARSRSVYDAHHHRITHDADTTGNGAIDTRREAYYDESWRAVQVLLRAYDTGTSSWADPHEQEDLFWGVASRTRPCAPHRSGHRRSGTGALSSGVISDLSSPSPSSGGRCGTSLSAVSYRPYGDPRHHPTRT